MKIKLIHELKDWKLVMQKARRKKNVSKGNRSKDLKMEKNSAHSKNIKLSLRLHA